MKILYKYCDCSGGIKILASLELKLPFVIKEAFKKLNFKL
jgi:hypothetical protein